MEYWARTAAVVCCGASYEHSGTERMRSGMESMASGYEAAVWAGYEVLFVALGPDFGNLVAEYEAVRPGYEAVETQHRVVTAEYEVQEVVSVACSSWSVAVYCCHLWIQRTSI